jgi:hypothetical protein
MKLKTTTKLWDYIYIYMCVCVCVLMIRTADICIFSLYTLSPALSVHLTGYLGRLRVTAQA